MRDARGSSAADDQPLLTAAIPGFRAWDLLADGRLAARAAGTSWTRGVNVARCAQGASHAAPDPGCMCGLYAFHAIHRQLADEPVVGGIGAWGEVEVHRDGFRAARARILALAVDRRTRARHEALERAAERYEVPLVPRPLLQPVVALRTGLLPPTLVELPRRERAAWLAGRRGYDVDAQVWVEPSAGVVTVGASPALRDWLDDEVRVEAAAGDDLRRGGALRVAGATGAVALPLGVGGRVAEVNTRLPALRGDEDDAEGEAWLVRLRPSAWTDDCRSFAWGPRGRLMQVATVRRDGQWAFSHLDVDGELRRASEGSWGDVLAALRAAREPAPGPCFADEAAVYDEVGIELGRALARDLPGRRHLEGLHARIAFETTEPRARLGFDFRERPATVRCGGEEPADVTVRLRAEDLPRLLGGRLDLARETRTGRLEMVGPRGAGLTALAALVRWTAAHTAGARGAARAV